MRVVGLSGGGDGGGGGFPPHTRPRPRRIFLYFVHVANVKVKLNLQRVNYYFRGTRQKRLEGREGEEEGALIDWGGESEVVRNITIKLIK